MEILRNLTDGWHFFAEDFPDESEGPGVLRVHVVEGTEHDAAWNFMTETWVETTALNPYRVNMGDYRLRSITVDEAQEIMASLSSFLCK